MADRSTEDGTYPPLDVLKPVAEGLWIVDSGPLRMLGMPLPIRMTVVRLTNGHLWLHSPTRFTEALCERLQREGSIRHLVAPSIAHWLFLRDWQAACPSAITWAVSGLRKRGQVRAANVKIDRELFETAPSVWADEFEQVIIRGLGFSEVDFFHLPSRTLIMADLVQNLETRRLPRLVGWLARLNGSAAPDGRAPLYLRLAVKAKRRQAAADRLPAFEAERVIFSHGRWFEHHGAEKLRRSLRWLTTA